MIISTKQNKRHAEDSAQLLVEQYPNIFTPLSVEVDHDPYTDKLGKFVRQHSPLDSLTKALEVANSDELPGVVLFDAALVEVETPEDVSEAIASLIDTISLHATGDTANQAVSILYKLAAVYPVNVQ
jgi:hypothetical protein